MRDNFPIFSHFPQFLYLFSAAIIISNIVILHHILLSPLTTQHSSSCRRLKFEREWEIFSNHESHLVWEKTRQKRVKWKIQIKCDFKLVKIWRICENVNSERFKGSSDHIKRMAVCVRYYRILRSWESHEPENMVSVVDGWRQFEWERRNACERASWGLCCCAANNIFQLKCSGFSSHQAGKLKNSKQHEILKHERVESDENSSNSCHCMRVGFWKRNCSKKCWAPLPLLSFWRLLTAALRTQWIMFEKKSKTMKCQQTNSKAAQSHRPDQSCWYREERIFSFSDSS